jgi:chromosomal replication initiation ATPase DnaA
VKNLQQRIQKTRLVVQTLMEELHAIDTELNQLANGHSCELSEVKIIQDMVAQHYGLTRQIMMSAVRTEEYANARGLAMFLSKELTFYGVREIALCFGGRSHAMVVHAHKRLIERMSQDKHFANDVEQLRQAAKCRIAEDLKDRKAASALIAIPQPQAMAS